MIEVGRPRSCPPEGAVPAFDAGWNAHEIGIERETVEVLTTDPEARSWALLGWDARRVVSWSARDDR